MKYYFGWETWNGRPCAQKWAEEGGVRVGPKFTGQEAIELTEKQYTNLSLEDCKEKWPYKPPV